MDAEIEKWSIKQLKSFLRERKEMVSGNKQELLERVKGVIFLNKKTVSETSVSDAISDGIRRFEKLMTPLSEILPDPESLKSNWKSDVHLFPNISNNDLYNYLVLSQNRTTDSQKMMATRQLKARVFYEDRHVYDLQYHAVNEECSHCFIRAKVVPSLPTDSVKNKPDYNVWVTLSKVTGRVHSANCTCAAGYVYRLIYI